MALVKAWEVLPHLEPNVNNGIEYVKQIQLEGMASAPSDSDLADGRIYYNTSINQFLGRANGSFVNLGAAGAGATTFVGLTDTPANFTGAGNKILKVNNAADAVEFVTLSGDVTINATGVAAIAAGVIVNADINASAAIAWSKMATSTDISSAGAVTDLTITNEAQGDVLYFDGSNWVRLAAGTSGYYLKTQGAGANPMWDAPSLATADTIAQSTTIEAGANDVTLSTTTQTVGGPTLTIPDFANVDDTFVFTTLAQTLTNKTLTSPVMTTPQINDTSADHQYIFAVSELAADRTITLPLLAGNDTFVFADFAQTLKNKILDDATTKFGDTADNTKDLFFSLGGATTAKTMTIISSQTDDRSVTLPDATCTLVGKDTTDVFTNKSFDCDGTGNALTNVNADELDPITVATGAYGLPFIITAVNTGTATITIFNANAPFKMRIIDAWAVSTKAGNSGTWVVDNGTNNITSAVAYGTADTDIARATDVDDAYHEIAANGTLRLISSVATDTAIVYIVAIRVD